MAMQTLQLHILETDPGQLLFIMHARRESGPRVVAEWPHDLELQLVDDELAGLARCTERVVVRGKDSNRLEGHARLLFDHLFPLHIKRVLRSGAGTLTVSGWRADTIPWSLLHDGLTFLGLKWALGAIDSPLGAVQAHRADGDRMLIVADPAADLPAARYEGEALVRTGASREGGHTCDLRLGAMRKSDFLRLLGRYNVLHFAGHEDPPIGDDPGGWRFSDGRLVPSDIAAVKGGGFPRLVFANACTSGGLAIRSEFLKSGAEHFIGTRVDLPDLSGADFADGFYQGLASGSSVGEALLSASQQSARRGDNAWMAYGLTGDPEVRYFRRRVLGQLPAGHRRAGIMVVAPPVLPSELEAFGSAYEAWRGGVKRIVAALGGRLLPGYTRNLRVVFGVPVSFENDLVRTAEAALEISACFPQTRMCVAEAEVVSVGVDVRSPCLHRLESDVGQVTLGIAIGATAAKALGARARLEHRGDDGAIYLTGLRDSQLTPDRPLIGRGEELAWLDQKLTMEIAPGDCRGVVLTGSAGIGKSHLVHAYADRVEGAMRPVFGRAAAYRNDAAYRPFADIVRALAGLEDGVDEAVAKTALGETLGADVDEGAEFGLNAVSIEALLDEALAGPSLDDRVNPLLALMGYAIESPIEHDDQIPGALSFFLNNRAQLHPILVVLEDVHWLPAAGLRLISYLLTECDPVRVRFLITARPGVVDAVDSWGRFDGVAKYALAPLDRRTAEALILQVNGGLEPGLLNSVIERAEGNPLYLRELALAVDRADGSNRVLPTGIEGVVQARLDRIPQTLLSGLQACAVLGREFSGDGLSALIGNAETASEFLRQLIAERFLQRLATSQLQQINYRFEHGLLQQVVYRGLDSQNRRALHGRAALWRLEHLRPNHSEDLADAAYHFQHAGDGQRSISHWLKAGASARAAAAADLALKCYKSALDLEDEAPGLLDRGQHGETTAIAADLSSSAGDLEAADNLWEQSISLCSLDNAVTRAGRMLSRAINLEHLGQRLRSVELINEARRVLGSSDGDASQELIFRLDRYSAWLKYVAGDLKGAADEFDVLLQGRHVSEPALVGLAINGRGVAAYGLGDYGGAERFFRAALAAFEEAGNSHRMRSAYNNLGMVAHKGGDGLQAVKWYEKALRISAKAGNRAALAHTYVNLGSLYGELGDFKRAEGFLRESIRIWEIAGHANVAVCYANLGEVLFKRADFIHASQYVERAIQLCQQGQGPSYLLPDAWRTMAEIRLAQDDYDAAHIASSEAVRLARQRGDGTNIGGALRVLGEVAFAKRQISDALMHLNGAVEHLSAVEQPLELAQAYRTLARILRTEDDVEAQRYEALAAELFKSRLSP